jgi:hypothetical protein
MSFQHTTRQILARTKDVTRRLGWKKLKAGVVLQAIEKGQGLKKGEHPRHLRRIRVKSVRRERLSRMMNEPRYGKRECVREGFPELTGRAFVEQFCRNMKCKPDVYVTRIEFGYEGETRALRASRAGPARATKGT